MPVGMVQMINARGHWYMVICMVDAVLNPTIGMWKCSLGSTKAIDYVLGYASSFLVFCHQITHGNNMVQLNRWEWESFQKQDDRFIDCIDDKGCIFAIFFWENDKNHTGLSPLGISAICGFVFTSDHVCSEGSMIIGLGIGTYFSLGFGVYSWIFGPYPSAQWFLIYYTNGPYQEIIALHGTYVDSSTWYSSYTIYVGISFPMAATHRLCLPYGSYVQSMLIPTNATLPWPIIASYVYQSLIPSSRPTENIIHLTFSPWHHTKWWQAMSLLTKEYPHCTQWWLFLQDIQEPHHPQVYIIISRALW